MDLKRVFWPAGFLVVAIVIGACGGDDGPAYDPENADAIAHAALLSPADLPGSGWVIAERDTFDDDVKLTDGLEDSASCKAAETKSRAAKDAAAGDRAGRARLSMELATKGAQISTSVDQTISIQKSTGATNTAMKAYRELAEGGELGKCLADVIKAGLGGAAGATVTATEAKPTGSVPKGGTTSTFDIVVTLGGQKLEMRVESYIWADENAGVTVQFQGEKGQITAELVSKALDAAQKKLSDEK